MTRKKILQTGIPALLMLGITISLIGFPGGFFTMLFRSFAVQFLLLLGVFSVYWLWRGRLLLIPVSVGCMVALQLCLPPLFDLSSEENPQREALRVAHFNVLKFNLRRQLTVTAAHDTNADILSFQEIDRDWETALINGLSDLFPYHYSIAKDENCYGLAVFSKYPLEDISEFYIAEMPNIQGQIVLPRQRLNFIASHTKAPTSPGYFHLRNRHLKVIAQRAKELEGPIITFGDYNTVPWDPAIDDYRETSRLSDSRKHLAPTYPTWFRPLSIPLDYIFHSRELACLNFSTIPGTGSDHLGVLGKYAWTTEESPIQTAHHHGNPIL